MDIVDLYRGQTKRDLVAVVLGGLVQGEDVIHITLDLIMAHLFDGSCLLGLVRCEIISI